MTASRWVKEAAPLAEDELCPSSARDDTAVPYTWLDDHAASDSKQVEDDTGFVDIDIDHVPTLHDVYEPSLAINRDGSRDDDEQAESVFWEPGDDMLEAQPSSLTSGTDVVAETPEKIDESRQHADNGAALAEHHGDASQVPMHSMEEVFNQVRRDPVLLQRALLVLACTFEVIAAAALWRAIGDKVVVTELVPPSVYASIGVVAYLLGMRYLRIHFAQVRVGDKDWLLCEQVVVAADNGVMLKARFGTAYLIWEQLLGVAQDSDYYYLLIEPSQGFKVLKQGVSDPGLRIKLDDLASLTKAKAWQDN